MSKIYPFLLLSDFYWPIVMFNYSFICQNKTYYMIMSWRMNFLFETSLDFKE